jgi:hypothetical protein
VKALRNSWTARLPALLRGLGLYAAIELLLPGGSLIALLVWLYRRRGSVGQRGHQLLPATTRAAAVIGGIPPHLSLPPFDVWRQSVS